jgi:hypothetical protein
MERSTEKNGDGVKSRKIEARTREDRGRWMRGSRNVEKCLTWRGRLGVASRSARDVSWRRGKLKGPWIRNQYNLVNLADSKIDEGRKLLVRCKKLEKRTERRWRRSGRRPPHNLIADRHSEIIYLEYRDSGGCDNWRS